MNLLPEISLKNASTLWNFYCFPAFLYFAFRDTMKNMDNYIFVFANKKTKTRNGWTEAKVSFSFILMEFVLFCFVLFIFDKLCEGPLLRQFDNITRPPKQFIGQY